MPSDVKYNPTGFANGMSRVHTGAVNRTATWSAPADPGPDDCLGFHSDAKIGSKGRPAYPVIKGGVLYRSGVIAAKQRAAAEKETEIESAANRLLEAIDKKALNAARRGGKFASLRTPVSHSDKSVEVDAETGVLKNVNLMEIGPARGHGFDIDKTSLAQFVAILLAKPLPVKTRFTHPKENTDGSVDDALATLVGCIKNPRIDGNCARGDVHLGTYAKDLPGKGNVWNYLVSLAGERPTDLGMSAVIAFDAEPETDGDGNVTSIPARISDVSAVDIVGEGAATPNGLLSAFPNGSPGPDSPIPPAVDTPDFLKAGDNRGAYLKTLVKHGPQPLSGIASRHGGANMQADLEWLVDTGHAEKVSGKPPKFAATTKGRTAAAMNWSR